MSKEYAKLRLGCILREENLINIYKNSVKLMARLVPVEKAVG